NTPTVFNATYNFFQFWDGRAQNLFRQIDDPIQNPIEMNSNWPEIISKLNKDKIYIQEFQNVYKSEIQPNLIKKSLVAFQNTLVTTEAAFDRYLQGDKHAITEDQKKGYELFKQYGCIACHQGKNIGG